MQDLLRGVWVSLGVVKFQDFLAQVFQEYAQCPSTILDCLFVRIQYRTIGPSNQWICHLLLESNQRGDQLDWIKRVQRKGNHLLDQILILMFSIICFFVSGISVSYGFEGFERRRNFCVGEADGTTMKTSWIYSLCQTSKRARYKPLLYLH